MSAGSAAGQSGCGVLPAGLVAAYAAGDLDYTVAWSVEAHVPGCADCRAQLGDSADAGRLQRNRDLLMTRLSLPGPGLAGRMLQRCGVPGHVTALLAATPSLRRSWLAGILLVLGAAVGCAQLAARQLPGAGELVLGSPAGWTPLLPFLVIAPLLPLAAVAVAFSPGFDPAHGLAHAAPVSKAWLLCVRSAAVIAATLIPTSVAALALPGPGWLAAAPLLPALGMCAAALALGTVTRPPVAMLGAAGSWTAAVLVVGATIGRPAAVFGLGGQLCAAAVLLGALALLTRRRHEIDYRWLG